MFVLFNNKLQGILFWDFKDERKEQDFGLEERTGLLLYWSKTDSEMDLRK